VTLDPTRGREIQKTRPCHRARTKFCKVYHPAFPGAEGQPLNHQIQCNSKLPGHAGGQKNLFYCFSALGTTLLVQINPATGHASHEENPWKTMGLHSRDGFDDGSWMGGSLSHFRTILSHFWTTLDHFGPLCPVFGPLWTISAGRAVRARFSLRGIGHPVRKFPFFFRSPICQPGEQRSRHCPRRAHAGGRFRLSKSSGISKGLGSVRTAAVAPHLYIRMKLQSVTVCTRAFACKSHRRRSRMGAILTSKGRFPACCRQPGAFPAPRISLE
jgi:hypothetical protein